MPQAGHPLRKLGFLTIGLLDEASPRAGHESTVDMIELGEQLGYDSAWARHRHLQFGIRRAARQVHGLRRAAHPAHGRAGRPAADAVRHRPGRHPRILTDIATGLGPALGWQPAV